MRENENLDVKLMTFIVIVVKKETSGLTKGKKNDRKAKMNIKGNTGLIKSFKSSTNTLYSPV